MKIEKFTALAKKIVSRMTVQEKISQLVYNSPAIERIIKDAPDAFRCDPYVQKFIGKGS